MKTTKFILATLIIMLFSKLASSQSFFETGELTYYLGAKTVPLQTRDFEDFHISDWEGFGLGSQEGRVSVPLANSEPESSIGVTIGAMYGFTEKTDILAELTLGFGGFSTTQLLFGANYYFYVKEKLRFGYSGKVGFGRGRSNFGEIEVLPGKTPPVILSEGTFNEGDDLKIELSTTTINLGLTSQYRFNKKIGFFASAGYVFSFGSKAVLKANETEIPLNSNGIVKPNGTSAQANINPTANIQGIDLSFGVSYNFK